MKVDVYDSYAKSSKGHLMHFDVFVMSGTTEKEALRYGRLWMEKIGENVESLKQSRCNFCHSESANSKIQMIIQKQGYFILQLEGCPSSMVVSEGKLK